MEKYTYWLILFCSFIIPFSFSFEKRISFYKTWKYLFPAIVITASFFIIWDHYFTVHGVWSFSEKYTSGIKIYNLPLEEIMFFIIIPYSCTFIYESLNYLIKNPMLRKATPVINAFMILLFIFLASTHIGNAYTFSTCFFASIYLSLVLLFRAKFLPAFYRSYLVSNIPFLIVNGLLTWLPVVIYNDKENSGIRVLTIPLEDFIYSFLLLLMTISLMEFFRKRNISNQE